MKRGGVLLLALVSCAHPQRESRPAAPPPASAPSRTDAAPPADASWRGVVPKGGPPPEVRLPTPQVATLGNGLKVILVESHALPLVAVQLVVFAGAEHARKEQAGLPDLVAAMLDEGTAHHDALGLAQALDSIGAELKTGASYDAAFVALTTLSNKLDEGLGLFAEVVTQPTFPESEIERLRQERMTALSIEKDQPMALLRNTLHRVLYGERHPYAFSMLGLETSLPKLRRAEVLRFWQRQYRPSNATLIVVGDARLDDMVKRLEARLGAWKGRSGAVGKPPAAPPVPSRRKVYWVDRPGAPQSVLAIAQVGVPRASPDYIPLLAMNHILGGSFSSRLNMNLRERNGYSYGVKSAFSFLRGPGPFFAGGSVRADVTKEALSEMLKEVEAVREHGVTEEELAEAKSSIIGKMPSRFETLGSIAAMLAELVVSGLPLDWYQSFAHKVSAITAQEVERVAQKYLRPGAASIIVVGDAAAASSLESLGLGKAEARGPFGEPK